MVSSTYKCFSLVPRATLYLVTSLLVLQLMSGLGVTTWGVIPTLTECWPWGRLACQVTHLISSDPDNEADGIKIKRPKSANRITPGLDSQ